MSTVTHDHKQAAITRPHTVTAAFWLFIASAVLAVIGAVVSTFSVLTPEGTAALRESILATPDAMTGEMEIETLVGIAQATAIGIQAIFGAVSLGVILWIAFATRSGRPYIRIVATILVVLQAIGTVAALSAVGVISLVLVVAAVVLIWTPSARRYFAERTARRRGSFRTDGYVGR